MITIANDDVSLDVRFTREEFGLIGNALNEVCNGVDFCDAEFSTRLGSEKTAARALLAQIVSTYRSTFEPEKWAR